MPAPVLLAADSVAGQSQFLKDIRPGKYEGFYLKLSGDAAAAQALTAAGFGRIEFLQGGQPFVSVDFDNMRTVAQLLGGNLRVIATAGGDHEFPVVIPRGWKDDNIQQVNQADQVQCKVTYGATFTTVFTGADTAIQKVYGLVRETGEMAYNLRIMQLDKSFGAGTFREPMGMENVLALYFIALADGLDRVRVLKDDVEMANIPMDTAAATLTEEDLQELTDWANGQEAATDAVATTVTSGVGEIELAKPGHVGEWLSDNVIVEYTTSPAAQATFETLIFAADFTDTKLRQTKAETASINQRKVARKQQFGKTRPVRVLEELGR